MFCTKCGKGLLDSSLFCNYCGEKIPNAGEIKTSTTNAGTAQDTADFISLRHKRLKPLLITVGCIATILFFVFIISSSSDKYKIVGVWYPANLSDSASIEFTKDGEAIVSYSWGSSDNYLYELDGDSLILIDMSSPILSSVRGVDGDKMIMNYNLVGDKLTILYDGILTTFYRQK